MSKKISKSELSLVLAAMFESMDGERMPNRLPVAALTGINVRNLGNRNVCLTEMGFISPDKMEWTEKGQRLCDAYQRLVLKYDKFQVKGKGKVRYFAGLIEGML